MRFAKLQSCGNDYVFIETFSQYVDNLPLLAKRISNRHTSIGSDGLIIISPSKTASYQMRVFNPDGSKAEMCGNALRCSAKFYFDLGLTNNTSFDVETLAGIKHIKLLNNNGIVSDVFANIGKPITDFAGIPCIMPQNHYTAKVCGEQLCLFAVSFGNPHCAIKCSEPEDIDLSRLGKAIENSELFPSKTNVEFYKIIDRNNIYIRTWERSCGETYGCATGSCACVLAGVSLGLLSIRVTVHQRGGDIFVSIADNGELIISGSPTTVFTEEYLI